MGHVLKFGNGTTAIYAALRALRCINRLVILPANICPSVIAAIHASSNVPLFVDIEQECWGLDPQAVAQNLDQVGAVIAVHMFGIPCRIDEIMEVCRAHGVPVIEDCAQAEGARHNGVPVGAFGDVAVFSYGAGKIISAGGGGAAATDDMRLYRALQAEHEGLPPASGEDGHAILGAAFKQLYNTDYPQLTDLRRQDFGALLQRLAPSLLSRHDPSLEPAIASGMATLESNIAARATKVGEYHRLLSGVPGLKFIEFPEASAPWRCNLLLEFETRQKLLKEMLHAGMNVSSWFPDIRAFLPKASYHSAELPNSLSLDRRVLNLWVTDVTSDDIRATCDRIVESLR